MSLALIGGSAFIELASSAATIDFDWPSTSPPGTNWSLPWSEEGFTVSANSYASLQPTRFTSPPYTGDLLLNSRFSPWPPIYELALHGSTVVITNDTGAPFSLESMEFVSMTLQQPSTNAYARVVTSAGGSCDLVGRAAGSILNFSGSGWEGLSWVSISFTNYPALMPGGPSSFPELDNFVVQVENVPESSPLFLSVLGGGTLFLFRRCWFRRRQCKSRRAERNFLRQSE
jgi:hypothetical protein